MKRLCIITIVIISICIACTSSEKKISILDENFNENTKGWIQERANYHDLEIKDGHYFIESKDSTDGRTSSNCLDRSFLNNLPEEYSVFTDIDFISTKNDSASCGLLFEGQTIEYEFRIYNTGEIEIEEYNLKTEERLYYNKIKKITIDKPLKHVKIQINIKGWDFEIIANNEKCGSGTLNSKTWYRIVPFAGTLTEIKIDYLRIMDLSE